MVFPCLIINLKDIKMRSILTGLVWQSRAQASSCKKYCQFGQCIFGAPIEVPDNIIHPSFNIDSKLTAQVVADGANTFAFAVKKKQLYFMFYGLCILIALKCYFCL